MVDMYGTPHSSALHVVERYRLVDYDAAKDALERNEKENSYIAATAATGIVEVDLNYRGKVLQLHFTVEDNGVFTTPWTNRRGGSARQRAAPGCAGCRTYQPWRKAQP